MLSRHFFLLLAPNGGVPLFISLGKAICPLLCGTIGQAGDPVVPALALWFGLASLVLPELHTQCMCLPHSCLTPPPHSFGPEAMRTLCSTAVLCDMLKVRLPASLKLTLVLRDNMAAGLSDPSLST